MRQGSTPYEQFGRRLNEIRKQLQESIPEVSGAVEVETETIRKYEAGEERPSEDVLLLLINHFDIKDEEADELWDLAGYGQTSMQPDMPITPAYVVMPADNRIVYTDSANIVINNYGVVMNFMQNTGTSQPMAIARVGMSLDHAKRVLEVLAATIDKAEQASQPKVLKASRTVKSKSNKKSS